MNALKELYRFNKKLKRRFGKERIWREVRLILECYNFGGVRTHYRSWEESLQITAQLNLTTLENTLQKQQFGGPY